MSNETAAEEDWPSCPTCGLVVRWPRGPNADGTFCQDAFHFRIRTHELTHGELLAEVEAAIGRTIINSWGPVRPPGQDRARALVDDLHRAGIQVSDRSTLQRLDLVTHATAYEAGLAFGRRVWRRAALTMVVTATVCILLTFAAIGIRLPWPS